MPSPTPVNTSKGAVGLGKTRRPTKVSAAHLGPCEPPVGTPGHSGLTPPFSWPFFVWADDTGIILTKIELLPSHSTVALIEEPTKEPTDLEDPWDLPELKPQGIKWAGKNEISRG